MRMIAREFPMCARVDVASTGARCDDGRAAWTREVCEGSSRYEVAMSIADALDARFVKAYAGTGGEGEAARTGTRTFGMITRDVDVDANDCWCVTPSGRFVASLTSTTASMLGLGTTEDARGKRAASVNCRREKFRVSNRFHDRLGACARTLEGRIGKSDVFCASLVDGRPEDVTFPPTVMEASRVANETVSERVMVDLSCEEAILLASMDPPNRGESKPFEVDDLERILEFCGRLSLGNEYVQGDASERKDAVDVHRLSGFLLHPEIERAIEFARKLVNDHGAPWSVVTVWSFPQVPSNLTGAPVKKIERDPCTPKCPRVLVLVIYRDDKYLMFTT